MESLKDIEGIEWSESAWSALTSLSVGAGTVTVAAPENDTALAELLKRCSNDSIPVFVLGAGTNLVGSDENSSGIALKLSSAGFAEISFGRTRHVMVGAGATLPSLLRECAERGLGGYASLAPIPGTLGGALRMNAGADGATISDFVTELFGIRLDGSYWSADKDEISWEYRFSDIPDDVIVTGAICEFREVDGQSEKLAISAAFEKRADSQPRGRTAGCAFKNPSSELSAGWLIDRAGLKGTRVGSLEVSRKHANFIVNHSNSATESDCLELLKRIKAAVFADSGIILEPELRFVDQNSSDILNSCVKTPKVVVLKGGDSNEREVSLHSAEGVENALATAGCEVAAFDVANLAETERLFTSSDSEIPFASGEYVVFPVLHGGFGEDGRLQALLERLDIPFVGSPSKACALAMDKGASKKAMIEHSIPTPKYAVLERGESAFPETLTLPVVVKPPEEGSTVGISIVRTESEWPDALKEAFEFSGHALVEEFVEGAEITVGIVNGEALPVVEIRFPGEMFDFDAKYEHKLGETLYICPPESVPDGVQKEARRVSLDFAKAIDSTALTRVDLIIDTDGSPWVLEANNLPGFTSSSLLPKAAKAADMPFPVLCAILTRMARRDGI